MSTNTWVTGNNLILHKALGLPKIYDIVHYDGRIQCCTCSVEGEHQLTGPAITQLLQFPPLQAMI